MIVRRLLVAALVVAVLCGLVAFDAHLPKGAVRMGALGMEDGMQDPRVVALKDERRTLDDVAGRNQIFQVRRVEGHR